MPTNQERAIQLSADMDKLDNVQLLDKYGISAIRELAPLVGQLESKSAPGFIDRAAAGFATDPQGEVDILRNRGHDAFVDNGVVKVRTSQGTFPVDPEGFDFPGDIADAVGRMPRTVLGTLGAGVGGATGGPVGGFAGAALGGTLGTSLEQQAAGLLGSKQGVDVTDLALEPPIALAGEGLGRGVAAIGKRVLSPFKNALGSQLNKTVTGAAEAFDKEFGTSVRSKLPLGAQTENQTVQEIETLTSQLPFAKQQFDTKVRTPFQLEGIKVFDRLRAKIGGLTDKGPRVSDFTGTADPGLSAGEALESAARSALDERDRVVGQAYDELSELIAPNQPIDVNASLEAVQNIARNTGANSGLDIAEPLRKFLTKMESDVNKIENFGQLDSFRRFVGNRLRNQGINDNINRVGLDKQLAGLYGALVKDAETFFAQGGRMTDEQVAAGFRSFGEAAGAAGRAPSAGETASVSQAVGRLGGIDLAGVSAGEMSPKVARRLKTIQTQALNAGEQPQGVDQMAARLAEDFPELGIRTKDDLLEAMRLDSEFFTPKSVDLNAEAERAFFDREVQPDLNFRNVKAVEDEIEILSGNELSDFEPKLAEAVASGDMSQFTADRLSSRIQQRLLDFGGVEGAAREGVDATAEGFAERGANLGQEIADKGKRATGLAKENFNLQRSSANRVFADPDKVEGIVSKMLSSSFQPKQMIRLQQITGATTTPAGQKAISEGQHAWIQAQLEVLDHLRNKTIKGGTEGQTNAISGAKLLSAIESMGGIKKLEAIFGEENAQKIFSLSTLLRDADVGERNFANNSRSGIAQAVYGFIRTAIAAPLAAAGQLGAAVGVSNAFTNPTARTLLTQGVQSPAKRNTLRALGRLAGQSTAHTVQDQTRR